MGQRFLIRGFKCAENPKQNNFGTQFIKISHTVEAGQRGNNWG